MVPTGNIDGIVLSLVHFDFDPERSVKGESPLTYILGVVNQIFESERGFDGAKWPMFPSFEVANLGPGAPIPLGSVGIKNGRGKIMAMLLTVFGEFTGVGLARGMPSSWGRLRQLAPK